MKLSVMKLGVCGATLALLSVPVTASAVEGGALNSNGVVTFLEDTGGNKPTDPDKPDPDKPVTPIDPTDPDKPDQGTDGPLSLDFVPSFDFGQHTLSLKKQTYLAKSLKYSEADMGKTVNYVQVTDKRKASTKGWSLTLTQDAQFAADNKELKGAVFSINGMEARTNEDNPASVTPPTTGHFNDITIGEPHTIMAAEGEQGKGLWVNRFGSLTDEIDTEEDVAAGESKITDQYNTGVTLTVPANVADDVEYTTTFTWTLSNTPGKAEAGQ